MKLEERVARLETTLRDIAINHEVHTLYSFELKEILREHGLLGDGDERH